jgi:hypothetical protein
VDARVLLVHNNPKEKDMKKHRRDQREVATQLLIDASINWEGAEEPPPLSLLTVARLLAEMPLPLQCMTAQKWLKSELLHVVVAQSECSLTWQLWEEGVLEMLQDLDVEEWEIEALGYGWLELLLDLLRPVLEHTKKLIAMEPPRKFLDSWDVLLMALKRKS